MIASDRNPWIDRASCRGVDPALFFPARGEPTDAAKAICARCPVRVECGDFAMASNERYGIWGGLSQRQLRQARSEAVAS